MKKMMSIIKKNPIIRKLFCFNKFYTIRNKILIKQSNDQKRINKMNLRKYNEKN
jgi:hypothetical protein